jgi:homoserine O-acetyltransferase
MGGMTCLEYALNTPPGFVKHIIPIATSARHSAWCISWGEAQRQSIYSDPAYDDGYYCYNELDDLLEGEEDSEERLRRIEERLPTRGLAAARMAALLTYRSRDSFESRFGRKSGGAKRGRGGTLTSSGRSRPSSPPLRSRAPGTPREDAWRAHNDGYRARLDSATSLNGSVATTPTTEAPQPQSATVEIVNPAKPDQADATVKDRLPQAAFQAPLTNLELSMPGGSRTRTPQPADGKLGTGASRTPQVFSAQSYLRYQGDKVSTIVPRLNRH